MVNANINIVIDWKWPVGIIISSCVGAGAIHLVKKITPNGAENILKLTAENVPEVCKSFLPLIGKDDENV